MKDDFIIGDAVSILDKNNDYPAGTNNFIGVITDIYRDSGGNILKIELFNIKRFTFKPENLIKLNGGEILEIIHSVDATSYFKPGHTFVYKLNELLNVSKFSYKLVPPWGKPTLQSKIDWDKLRIKEITKYIDKATSNNNYDILDEIMELKELLLNI